LVAALLQRGQALSGLRKTAGISLGQAVERELSDLSLSGAQFSAAFNDIPAKTGSGDSVGFNETGLDQVEFLIAPNPGEGLKPLVKIASGGETSRLMLALKNVLAAVDFIPTLIFDEIDQGIGGRVGSVVGEKLWKLGREHQVMCVTHLSQLAAYGDRHYRVRKQVVDDRTLTQVKALDDQERVAELALMNGSVSETNINSAFETLGKARERQSELS
jgi:DNA repair protein RecN (Recombination protein N)